mmetsp:Transcript_52464/g.145838  ORF Transcript_52464/g.145838 Transcript_52464/m.145838 type:complete len:171 (+) Transcript_52464:85-597(+)|eukprot:CAMPEP_0119466326 /NCGR_PEP_ID=MMETSP1344-20130328/1039_1 /TAXON_ID=236787 /ORGANISM="Florenciella parvula, Strain CCMP2471" /LENGTH=170 /DNA_ID=CAMNT_0007498635 /DNA_START=74 /DNA_END=586 /DNA_ORIENTATION=+
MARSTFLLLLLPAIVAAHSLSPALRRSRLPTLRPCDALRDMGAVDLTLVHQLRGGGAEIAMPAKTAWMILFGATFFELASTGFMHQAQGFSKLIPSALAILTYGVSFYLFNLSLKGIEISIAYSVWSAVVMAALSVIGMTMLGESVSKSKISGIVAIIVGTVLLAQDVSE